MASANQDVSLANLEGQTFKVATRDKDQGNFIIFDELSKHFRFKVEYVYFEQFSDILKAVKSGDADFTGNLTYSKERAKYIDISSPTNIEYTYLYTPAQFNVKQNLTDLKSIAVGKNLIFSSIMKENYPKIEIKEFDSYQEATAWLSDGTVEGVVDNISKLDLFLESGFTAQPLNDEFPIQPVSIAKTKGKYGEIFPAMVEYLHTPEIQKSIYMRMDAYQHKQRKKSLIQQVKMIGLDKSKPIKIKLENLTQLSEYKNNKIEGIAADILSEICNILEIRCEVISTENEAWSSMYQDFLDKKIDVIAPITISDNRKKKILFGSPFYTTETVLIRKKGYKVGVYKSVPEMVTERIAVVYHDYYDQILSKMLPAKKLYRYPSAQDQFQALSDHEVDYVVMDRQIYNQMLLENKADLSTEEAHSIGVFHKSPFSFGFQKDESGQKLAMLFNEAQTLIDTDEIIEKYNKPLDWRTFIENEKKLNYKVWFSFTICILVLFVILKYVYQQSVTDNLTKLKNRRALYQKFSKGIGPELTFVYIDINKFKEINDTFGHLTGDVVLQTLSNRILKYWPGLSYRLGGDEFLLIANINEQQLFEVINQLSQFTVRTDSQQDIHVTISCGTSCNREQVMSIEEAMHLADLKMYEIKSMRA